MINNDALNVRPLNDDGRYHLAAGGSAAILNTYPMGGGGQHDSQVSIDAQAGGQHNRITSITMGVGGAYSNNVIQIDMAAGGRHDVVISTYQATGGGSHKTVNAFNIGAEGRHNRGNVVAIDMVAGGQHTRRATYTATASGRSGLLGLFEATGSGSHAVVTTYNIQAGGRHVAGLAFNVLAGGRSIFEGPRHDRVYRQTYRVADDSLERWELYVGIDTAPDLTGPPTATGTGLPINWTPPTPGPGLTNVLHVVVRKRNKYNLISFNQYPTLIEINESILEENGPITTPHLIKVLDGVALGALQMWARYERGLDRNPADTWEFYAKEGSVPVPDVDTPQVVQPMGPAPVPEVSTRVDITGLTPGSTYYTVVAARRSADNSFAVSSSLSIALAQSLELEAGNAGLFGGEEYVIRI